jgi:hypothetical protein
MPRHCAGHFFFLVYPLKAGAPCAQHTPTSFPITPAYRQEKSVPKREVFGTAWQVKDWLRLCEGKTPPSQTATPVERLMLLVVVSRASFVSAAIPSSVPEPRKISDGPSVPDASFPAFEH